MQLEDRCRQLAEELGLARAGQVRAVVPLTGGVASDIALVDLGETRMCMKFALPRLRVAADWQAPVHRNAAEYAWLQVAARIAPQSAVRLFGRSDGAHGFAMEFLEGEGIYLWKDRLLSGAPDTGEAAKVADLLGRIHATSAAAGFDRAPFDNRDDFHALRIEPYLLHTAEAHPRIAAQATALAEGLYARQDVLVHGDASPKNILFRNGGPIILDAECATMGDAAFDPAFCLNHLVLKAVHLPGSRARLLDEAARFWAAYSPHVDWEDVDVLEARVCALLPLLMLARVDGKSPVEYLGAASQQAVRGIALPLIAAPPARVADLAARVKRDLEEHGA